MVGNLAELVAEWTDLADACAQWSDSFGADLTCIGGSGTTHFPGVIFRGGRRFDGTNAGVFSAVATVGPSFSSANLGFRGVR